MAELETLESRFRTMVVVDRVPAGWSPDECVMCDAPALKGRPFCSACAGENMKRGEPLVVDDFIRAPMPQPCSVCPWRVENQIDPPLERQGAKPWYYRAVTRRALWGAWGLDGTGLGDGTTLSCHETYPFDESGRVFRSRRKIHECPGAAALQQRAVIRWCETRERGPLRGNAARRVIARVFGVDVYSIKVPGESVLVQGSWIKSRGWSLRGRPITADDLIRVAHPGVLDPMLASEEVPPPTGEEIERWSAIAESDGA